MAEIVKVEAVGEIYLCNICGNEVIVTKVGGGTLFCCGKPMVKTGEDEEYETEEHEEGEE